MGEVSTKTQINNKKENKMQYKPGLSRIYSISKTDENNVIKFLNEY